MLFITLLIFAYLIGSLSTAIILCYCLKLPDPRLQGSGNPGATNVLRFAGKKLAILVLIGDILKGVFAVFIAKLLFSSHFLGWIALAVFLGHLYPIFFKFQGGKGVATALGAILVLSWPLALVLIAAWLIVAILFRYSSLASIVAAIASPIAGYWFLIPAQLTPIIIMTALLLIRHKGNIERLLKGEEGKIGVSS